MPASLPPPRCALAAPFHPCPRVSPGIRPRGRAGGLLSVALSPGSPPPGVTRHRASVEPGLSSPPKRSGRPTVWRIALLPRSRAAGQYGGSGASNSHFGLERCGGSVAAAPGSAGVSPARARSARKQDAGETPALPGSNVHRHNENRCSGAFPRQCEASPASGRGARRPLRRGRRPNAARERFCWRVRIPTA